MKRHGLTYAKAMDLALIGKRINPTWHWYTTNALGNGWSVIGVAECGPQTATKHVT